MTDEHSTDIEASVRRAFSEADVEVRDLRHRRHPDEDVFVVDVDAETLDVAGRVATQIEQTFESGSVLISVRRAAASPTLVEGPLHDGVGDERAGQLRQLISARSRTSEMRPSVSYIPDAALNIDSVATARHQLIFGRRGAGKTALMVEAKSTVEERGSTSVWLNMHTYRLEPIERIFLHYLRELLDSVRAEASSRTAAENSATLAAVEAVFSEISRLLDMDRVDEEGVRRIIPDTNRALRRFLSALGIELFVFLDDFYYVPRPEQATLLDMMHGVIRDCDCWLKVASIRNLTKWFITSPPTGLETGHDADLIDLDVTLQDPARAKEFLEAVLSAVAERVGIPRLTALFSPSSLDRLVLASGGVPRDYMVLAGSSITKAQSRGDRKFVGVEDVNESAGNAAQVKIQELEEDGSANSGVPEQATKALLRIRDFCLDETSYTYFRVRHQDRDHRPEAFSVLNRLVEFRLLHSVAASVSNQHRAGDASEVFMLDLSQFTGSRLKQKLWVLEIESGRLFAKRTRDAASRRDAPDARDLVAIFRASPEFKLSRMDDLVATADHARLGISRALRRGASKTVAELVAELLMPYRVVTSALDELREDGLISSEFSGDQEIFRAESKK